MNENIKNDEYDEVFLYSINYLGISPTLIDKRESLKNYKKYMQIYKKLYIYKCVMYSIFLIFFICPFFYINYNTKLYQFIIALIFLLIIIIHFIILIYNCLINRKYILNILYIINEDNNKVEKISNILNLVLTGLILLSNIYAILLAYVFGENSYIYDNS